MFAVVKEFVWETAEILVLIYLATYIIGLLQEKFSPEKVRDFVSGKNRWIGYFTAVAMGIFTPFCSCSSIPIFIGFLAAGLPFGISMAFLVSSPLISEIAIIILSSVAEQGLYLMSVYVAGGVVLSVLSGYLADYFKLENCVIFKFPQRKVIVRQVNTPLKESLKIKLKAAHMFAYQTLKSIWVYVIVSLAIGFLFQAMVSEAFVAEYLQGQKWWEVPAAVVLGVPFYANHGALMPFIQSLLEHNVSAGTSMALLMSATAISVPELIMLKKIVNLKMLGLFVGWLTISFIIIGYLLNSL